MSNRIPVRIIAFRKHLGWSQRELAEKAGVSPTTINRIENGADVSISTLLKIESALGVTLF